MRIKKGEPGYIKARKLRFLASAIFEFGVVIALVLLGIRQFGTRLNLFTVIAIVFCLPASRMTVEFIVTAPHKGVSPEIYAQLQEKAPLPTKLFDVLITGTESAMCVDAFVICGRTVCGYASSEKTDEVRLARLLKDQFASARCEKITVRIFHDYSAFLARAEGMNRIASVDHTDNQKLERKLKQIILSQSI